MSDKSKILDLSQWNGNVFFIMGKTQQLLRRAQKPENEVNKLMEDCKNQESYHAVLGMCTKALEDAGYEITYGEEER